jgi:ubiquinone/menaquinone biosynthesis C-methylase UbiE
LAAPAEVYAVELDSEILNQAQRYITKEGAANCTFIADEARNLPNYVPKGVSYVLLANTFHGISDKVGISRAVHEVLRLQGRFVIVN